MRTGAWMPLYVGDYVADTMHLSGPEHGAYLLLLMHSWRTGPLPDDDRALAAIARTEPAAWRRMRGTIRGFFTAVEGGLVQPRLERERAEAAWHAERRAAASQQAARSRWNRAKAGPADDASGMRAACAAQSGGIAGAMRSECPTPSPSRVPSSTLRADDGQAAAPPAAGAAPLLQDVRTALWTEGVQRLRRITGKPDRAARALVGRWLKAAGDDCALVAAVLVQAEMDRPGVPEAWIQAAIDTRMGRGAAAVDVRKPERRWGWEPMFDGSRGARPPDQDDEDIIDVDAEAEG